jgi:hypothetical protein
MAAGNDGLEDQMKQLPNVLLILAAVGIAIGLAVRLVQTASGVVRPAFLDPVFYWRGAMALLTIGILIVLIQIRDK